MSLRSLGWLVAAALILWLFILGALVPWISGRLQELMEGLPV
jgi:hypothetical protein